MEIKKIAHAGTLESNDALVTVDKSNDGIEVDLESEVEKQYGNHIRKLIYATLNQLDIKDARVSVHDRGALDCTIRARIQAACYRAAESQEYEWGE